MTLPFSAMINQLEGRFMEKETTDILLQEFHQMMMGPKDKVHEFGGKLEYKFRLLQERCPGRYNMAQLKDRLFHGMTDKLRDSVRYLFTNPTVDFNQLLKAAMTCEIETTSRQATKAKAMQFSEGVSESSTNPEISSIRSQLEQMSTILKGANFSGSKENSKKKGNGYFKQKGDGRQGLKGPGTSAAGPFRKDKPPVQCYQCMGWWHYARNCPNEFPVEGSINWGKPERGSSKTGWYSSPTGQYHPDAGLNPSSDAATGPARAITSTISKRVNKGGSSGGRVHTSPRISQSGIHLLGSSVLLMKGK